jgi:hypothetical protein
MGALSRLPGIVANALGSALGDDLKTATLTKPGAATADGRGGETRAAGSSFDCKAIMSDYSDNAIAFSGGKITEKDRTALVLGATLQAGIIPKNGDGFAIDGESWTVIRAIRDPAQAAWQLQLRPA